jgi:cardiolipin synthase
VAIQYAWSTAATLEPWAEGRAFYPRIFADVEAARSSVHVLMYGWRDGEVGLRMAEILERRLREGVEVRLLVDALGSRALHGSAGMYARLAAAGAAIAINDALPLDRDGLYRARRLDWRQDEFGRADHRKLVVVDGRVAWLGGAGFEDHFADGRFHDVMARVTGDVVLQAQAVFLTSFAAHGAPLPRGPDGLARYFPPPPDPGTTPAALLQVVPGGFQSATQAIRERIDGARARLDVMNPYLTDPDMLDRIRRAARRGVRVRLVTSARSNNRLAATVLRQRYRDLTAAGVEIWEYPDAVVHAKILVADDWVQLGTVNLDAWALYRNFEIGLLAHSCRAAALLEERVFAPDIARSRPGRPPSGLARRLGQWLGRWPWAALAYFL